MFFVSLFYSTEWDVNLDGTILVNGALTAGLYAVDILCCDDQGYDLQTLYVHCRMAPTFLNIPTTISISETTPIQTSIFAVQASNNGYAGTSWTYLIVPTSNTFQIDPLSRALINFEYMLIEPIVYIDDQKLSLLFWYKSFGVTTSHNTIVPEPDDQFLLNAQCYRPTSPAVMSGYATKPRACMWSSLRHSLNWHCLIKSIRLI